MTTQYVDIRETFNGPIVRGIIVETLDNSAYTLACSLTRIGELNLTVLFGAQGIAGQILAGYYKGGWFVGHGNYPVFRCINPTIHVDNPTYKYLVNIHDKINGTVVMWVRGINPYRSAYDLACKLIHVGERDITVLSDPFTKLGKRVQAELLQNTTLPLNAYGKAFFVLDGHHRGGWYFDQKSYPEYIRTPQEEKNRARNPAAKIL